MNFAAIVGAGGTAKAAKRRLANKHRPSPLHHRGFTRVAAGATKHEHVPGKRILV